jgi:hypothetical protein
MGGNPSDPRGNEKDKERCKEKFSGRSSDGKIHWLKMVSKER